MISINESYLSDLETAYSIMQEDSHSEFIKFICNLNGEELTFFQVILHIGADQELDFEDTYDQFRQERKAELEIEQKSFTGLGKETLFSDFENGYVRFNKWKQNSNK